MAVNNKRSYFLVSIPRIFARMSSVISSCWSSLMVSFHEVFVRCLKRCEIINCAGMRSEGIIVCNYFSVEIVSKTTLRNLCISLARLPYPAVRLRFTAVNYVRNYFPRITCRVCSAHSLRLMNTRSTRIFRWNRIVRNTKKISNHDRNCLSLTNVIKSITLQPIVLLHARLQMKIWNRILQISMSFIY